MIQDPEEGLKKQLEELEVVMAGGRILEGMHVLAAGDRAKKGVVIADDEDDEDGDDKPYKVRWIDGEESRPVGRDSLRRRDSSRRRFSESQDSQSSRSPVRRRRRKDSRVMPADIVLDEAAAEERHKEKVKELEELQAVKREEINKGVTVVAMLLDSKAIVDAVDVVRREEERVRASARERDVYRQTDRQKDREKGEGQRERESMSVCVCVCVCVCVF